MITAQEARTRYVNIAPLLDELEVLIKDAADKGLHSVPFYSMRNPGVWCARRHRLVDASLPELTPVQKQLIEALKKYGYTTTLEAHGEPYVPLGLQKENESDFIAVHMNFVLVVKW